MLTLNEHARSASLLTPPRTRHKRSLIYNDSDGDVVNRSPRKKRRRLDEEDEDAFWTGRGGSPRGVNKVAQTDKTEKCSPSPAILSYRVKAPVSPPPSRRQPLIQPARASSVEHDAIVTPRLLLRASTRADTFKTPTKFRATKIWPKCDSPNNPFLVASTKLYAQWGNSDDEEEVGEAQVRERTLAIPHEERPTITYVFRGQKATFRNPLYRLAPEVIAASKLPIDHPDYEAPEACPPRRLFFSAGKRRSRSPSRAGASGQGVKRTKVGQSEDDIH